jgi:hypothetical protein
MHRRDIVIHITTTSPGTGSTADPSRPTTYGWPSGLNHASPVRSKKFTGLLATYLYKNITLYLQDPNSILLLKLPILSMLFSKVPALLNRYSPPLNSSLIKNNLLSVEMEHEISSIGS